MSETEGESLHTIVGLLRVLVAPQLEALREHYRSDELAHRILDATSAEWMSGQELNAAIEASSPAQKKATQRKCVELVQSGLLAARGIRAGRMYRATNIL